MAERLTGWCVCGEGVFVGRFADGSTDLRLRGELDIAIPASYVHWFQYSA